MRAADGSGTLYKQTSTGGKGDRLYPVNFDGQGTTTRARRLKPGGYLLEVKGRSDTKFTVEAGSGERKVDVQ